MRAHPLGKESAIIGEVVEDKHGFVQMTPGWAAGASSTGWRESSCREYADNKQKANSAVGLVRATVLLAVLA